MTAGYREDAREGDPAYAARPLPRAVGFLAAGCFAAGDFLAVCFAAGCFAGFFAAGCLAAGCLAGLGFAVAGPLRASAWAWRIHGVRASASSWNSSGTSTQCDIVFSP